MRASVSAVRASSHEVGVASKLLKRVSRSVEAGAVTVMMLPVRSRSKRPDTRNRNLWRAVRPGSVVRFVRDLDLLVDLFGGGRRAPARVEANDLAEGSPD